uniref:3,4-dihydroxy-2-butanone-4-phosphate synthase n=1 Tax=Desulfosarcina cetonica TaxID=90730 RepID=UPI0006D0459C
MASDSLIVGIETAIQEIRDGRMVILVDDEGRENEGDLCCAAEAVTPEFINFMAIHGRGLICLTLEPQKADQLGLNPMVRENNSPFETAFTVSIDAACGITTGISAQDRAHTIRQAMSPTANPSDFVRPGHIFPLRARRGGVLVRTGQTEGSVDLARLAGFEPAGVICEIMNEDGSMARMPDLCRFAKTHDLNIVTIADLIRYRTAREQLVRRTLLQTSLPRAAGPLKVAAYTSEFSPDDAYIALIKGAIQPEDEVLVRIHRECFLGDFMGSLLCDCGRKLQQARELITARGKGLLLYVRPRDAATA